MTDGADDGRRPPRPAASGGWTWSEAGLTVVVAHLALLIVGGIVITIGGWTESIPIEGQFVALLPFWVIAVAGPWRLAARAGDPRDALALRIRPIDVPVGVAVGVVVQLVVIPLVYWPLFPLFDSSAEELREAAQDLVDSASGAFGTVVFVAMTCVIAPVVEELLYRAFLQRSGDGRRPWLSIGVAAVVFASLHLQPLQFVGLAIFGAVAGVMVWRTGRIGPAVVAHVAFNATTVVGLLAGR